MNKKGYMDEAGLFLIFALGTLILLVMSIIVLRVDSIVIGPKVADKANNICISKGYDFVEDFERVVFTTTPLAIKCKYVTNRRDINLDVS